MRPSRFVSSNLKLGIAPPALPFEVAGEIRRARISRRRLEHHRSPDNPDQRFRHGAPLTPDIGKGSLQLPTRLAADGRITPGEQKVQRCS